VLLPSPLPLWRIEASASMASGSNRSRKPVLTGAKKQPNLSGARAFLKIRKRFCCIYIKDH
jgi:hypothetical protein